MLYFYISKIEEQHNNNDESKPGDNNGNAGYSQNQPNNQQGGTQASEPMPVTTENDIKKAKNLVKQQTMPSMMWQKVVLDMIESHPEVSSFLIEYLGS